LLDTQQPSLFQRHDETIVHEAIREAFVNALIHADFRGQGGIIVERHRDRLEFSNPGTLLLSIEQVLKGGVSECRNKVLQTMFAMLGYGERAGSGIDKIRQGWASQKWRWPLIEEQLQPDRVRLTLPMVSLLPEESLVRLRAVLGENLGGLDPREVQALVTADVEGSVTNQRLQQFMAEHTVDITRVLQELVGKGLLVKDGYGRWASYRLSEGLVNSGYSAEGTPDITAWDTGDTAPGSPHKPGSSPHNGPSSPHKPASSPHNGPSSPQDDPALSNPALLAIAEPSRTKERLPPEQTEEIILELCRGRFLTNRQIGALLRRDAKRTKDRFLSRMVKDGRLRAKYADPTHPEQAYQTNPEWRES
jgi:ATP-dependent DNA helicase RecG